MNSEAEYRDLEFQYLTARLESLQQALCGFPEALAA